MNKFRLRTTYVKKKDASTQVENKYEIHLEENETIQTPCAEDDQRNEKRKNGGHCEEDKGTVPVSDPREKNITLQYPEERDLDEEDPYDTIHSFSLAPSDRDTTERKTEFHADDWHRTGTEDDSENLDDSAISSGTSESNGSGFVCPIHAPQVCDQGCVDKNRSKYIEYLIEVFRPLLVTRVHVAELLPHLPFLQSDKSQILARNKKSNKDGIYELLSCIHRNDTDGKWQALLDALNQTDNTHLKKLLDGTREDDPFYHRNILQIYTPEVMRQIHLKEFTDHLFQEAVINERDKQRIENIADKKCEIDAIYELLDTIPNRLGNWNDIFLKVLRRLGCSHIADEIEEVTSPTEISKRRSTWKKKKKKKRKRKALGNKGINNQELPRPESSDETVVKRRHEPCRKTLYDDTMVSPLALVKNKKSKDSTPPLTRESHSVNISIPPFSQKRDEPGIVAAHQHQQEVANGSDPPPLPPRLYLLDADIPSNPSLSIDNDPELPSVLVSSKHEYSTKNGGHRKLITKDSYFYESCNNCKGTNSVPDVLTGGVLKMPDVQFNDPEEEIYNEFKDFTGVGCSRQETENVNMTESKGNATRRQRYLDKYEEALKEELSVVKKELRSLAPANECDIRASADGYMSLLFDNEVGEKDPEYINTGKKKKKKRKVAGNKGISNQELPRPEISDDNFVKTIHEQYPETPYYDTMVSPLDPVQKHEYSTENEGHRKILTKDSNFYENSYYCNGTNSVPDVLPRGVFKIPGVLYNGPVEEIYDEFKDFTEVSCSKKENENRNLTESEENDTTRKQRYLDKYEEALKEELSVVKKEKRSLAPANECDIRTSADGYMSLSFDNEVGEKDPEYINTGESSATDQDVTGEFFPERESVFMNTNRGTQGNEQKSKQSQREKKKKKRKIAGNKGISNQELPRPEISDDTFVKTIHEPFWETPYDNTMVSPLAPVQKQKSKDSSPPLTRESHPVNNSIHQLQTGLGRESHKRDEPGIVTAHQHQQEVASGSDPPPLPPKPCLLDAGIPSKHQLSIFCDPELPCVLVNSQYEYSTENGGHRNILTKDSNFYENSNNCNGTNSIPDVLPRGVFKIPGVLYEGPVEEIYDEFKDFTGVSCSKKETENRNLTESEENDTTRRQRYLNKYEEALKEELSIVKKEKRSLAPANGCVIRASADGYMSLSFDKEVGEKDPEYINTAPYDDTVVSPLDLVKKQKSQNSPPTLTRESHPVNTSILPLRTRFRRESQKRDEPGIITPHQHQQEVANGSDRPPLPPRLCLLDAGLPSKPPWSIFSKPELPSILVSSKVVGSIENGGHKKILTKDPNFDENSNNCKGTNSVPDVLPGGVFKIPGVLYDDPEEEIYDEFKDFTGVGCSRKETGNMNLTESEGNARRRQRYLNKHEEALKEKLSVVIKEKRTLATAKECDIRTSAAGYERLSFDNDVGENDLENMNTGESSATDQDVTGQFSPEEEGVFMNTNGGAQGTEHKNTQSKSDDDLLDLIKDLQQKITNFETRMRALSSKQ